MCDIHGSPSEEKIHAFFERYFHALSFGFKVHPTSGSREGDYIESYKNLFEQYLSAARERFGELTEEEVGVVVKKVSETHIDLDTHSARQLTQWDRPGVGGSFS